MKSDMAVSGFEHPVLGGKRQNKFAGKAAQILAMVPQKPAFRKLTEWEERISRHGSGCGTWAKVFYHNFSPGGG